MMPKMATQAVWAGEQQANAHGTTQVPIAQSIAFTYDDLDEWQAVALGQLSGHIYSRNTNPTVHTFEEKVRILEGADAAVSFASGMAAISNTLFAFLKPGDRLVSVKDTYGGTNELFQKFLPEMNVQVTLSDTTGHEQIESDHPARLSRAVPRNPDQSHAEDHRHSAPVSRRSFCRCACRHR